MTAPSAEAQPELHPVTKTPWTCACRMLRAQDCADARYPSRSLPFEDEPEEPNEPCECGCHDWEGDEEDPYGNEDGRW